MAVGQLGSELGYPAWRESAGTQPPLVLSRSVVILGCGQSAQSVLTKTSLLITGCTPNFGILDRADTRPAESRMVEFLSM